MMIPRKKEKGNIFYSLGAWSYPSSVPIINKFHLSVVSQRSYMIHFYASLNCNWLWLSDPTPLCLQTLKSHPLHNLHIPLMRFSTDLPMFLREVYQDFHPRGHCGWSGLPWPSSLSWLALSVPPQPILPGQQYPPHWDRAGTWGLAWQGREPTGAAHAKCFKVPCSTMFSKTRGGGRGEGIKEAGFPLPNPLFSSSTPMRLKGWTHWLWFLLFLFCF